MFRDITGNATARFGRAVALSAAGFLSIALTVVLGLRPLPTLAAEMEIVGKAVEIRGEIVKGDSERFADALRKAGPEVLMVRLRGSPGGNLTEAMKIGDLIRQMKLITDVAILVNGGPAVGQSPIVNADGSRDLVIGTDEEAMCASACFFIWMAGVRRQGDYLLVVHRPYFDPAQFAQLDSDQAQSAYASLEKAAYSYLQAMGTPQSTIDLMRRTSSSNGARLEPDFVNRELHPMAPDIDEWLRAKCGSFSADQLSEARAWSGQAPDDLWQEMGMVYAYGSKTNHKAAWDAAVEKFKCMDSTMATERFSAWMRAYGQ